MNRWLTAIGSAVAGEAQARAQRFAMKAVLGLLAVALLLVSAGFLVGALYTALERSQGPLAAQLIVAAIFALAGLVFAVAAAMAGRRPQEPAPLTALNVEEELGTAGKPAGLAGVAAAFAFGFARGLTRRRSG